ncbi:MAG: hypothetical protein JWM89_2191 [Acidimicrobiales bacterium]|nr:hypothetical protein [Acidimicrobiales bacterium]
MRTDSIEHRARIIGTLRALVGVAMIAAPRAVARPAPDGTVSGTELFLLRTIGVRDLALGLGTLAATRSGRPAGPSGVEGIRRWTRFGLLSDALDVVTGSLAVPLVGKDGATIAATVPLPFVALDIWTLRAGDADLARA